MSKQFKLQSTQFKLCQHNLNSLLDIQILSHTHTNTHTHTHTHTHAGIGKDEKLALLVWFKAQIKKLYRCVGATMLSRWSYIKASLVQGGHGDFSGWFERTHLSGDWQNWSYRASGVPGVVTNGNPIESWHNMLKCFALIDTNRVMDWKLFGDTLPKLLQWCAVSCTGVSLEPDATKPIPYPTLKKAKAILDSKDTNMRADSDETGCSRDQHECFYFNTSATWGRAITSSRVADFDDFCANIADYPSAKAIDDASHGLHRCHWEKQATSGAGI